MEKPLINNKHNMWAMCLANNSTTDTKNLVWLFWMPNWSIENIKNGENWSKSWLCTFNKAPHTFDFELDSNIYPIQKFGFGNHLKTKENMKAMIKIIWPHYTQKEKT